MDEEWKNTMDSFRSVWPRVRGESPPPPHGPAPSPPPHNAPPPPPPPEGPEARDTRTLAGFIREEDAARQFYLMMSRRASGKTATALSGLAVSSGRMVRKLQAEYILRAGDSFPPERIREENLQGTSLSAALRQAWQDAGRMESAYRDAAERTREPDLRKLYRDGVTLKQSQRRILRNLSRTLTR